MMSKQVHPHGEQLSAYIDGMLDVGKTRSVAEHLRACAPCRVAAGQLEETKTLLRRMPAPARPGPEFWTEAYRRLRVDDRERALPRRPLWEAWRGPEQAAHRRWAAGLAAIAAVGAMIAGPLQHTQPGVMSPPPSPVSAQDVSPDVSPDVSSLVESHTDSVSRLPLADPDRQKMIAADARQASSEPSEAAGYADIAF
jgi:anti-sigma factor RsiW